MASQSTLLVPVGEPNALAYEKSISVPGQDLFNIYVTNLHVIPDAVDLDRFQAALSKTLARYPPAAGRLKREGDSWKIILTNDPVPVVVVRLNPDDAESRRIGFPFPDDYIIQDYFTTYWPFINSDSCNAPSVRGEGTEALLGFKLTYWEQGTVIGISWCHTLGDAKPLFDFTCCLSTLYDDINALDDRLPLAPSFYRHTFPHPYRPGATTENMLPRMSHLAQDYSLSELPSLYEEMEATSDLVQMRITGASLSQMLQDARGGEDVHLSTQDALTAYLVTVLNRCYDKPITKFTNTVNYRFPNKDLAKAPIFAHPAAFTNCVLTTDSDQIPQDESKSIRSVARVVRTSIEHARQPDFVEKWQTFGSYLTAKSANADADGRFPYLASWDGEMAVNSNYRYDWLDAHFGYPGRARFYTAWAALNVFRIFRANPRANSAGDQAFPDANVSVRILRDLSPKFIEIIKREYMDTMVQDQR